MKFGKQLEISANPEWRDNYVQYKRLKRLIKRVAFELEKQQNAQKKLQLKLELSGSSNSTGDVPLQVLVDETHPLLQTVGDEVQDAKDQFWEVLDANLKIVNDFFVAKIKTLTRSIGDFEALIEDEKSSTGHVHTRTRTHSQDQPLGVSEDCQEAGGGKYGAPNAANARRSELAASQVFVLLLLIRITPKGEEVQQRCLAMLVFITMLWVTEALPYFATALLVPPLVVFLQILNDKADPDTLLTARQSAKEVMSMLVNHTTILIMGGICEMPDRALYCRLLATSIQEKSELVPARNHAHGTVFIDVD
uniref:SPX domain-containing protein n=1 Tax=Hyaloperonospora arabidopsidis (strain Emoy2) TaxID=559515 RepID=M4B2I2_HYAAE